MEESSSSLTSPDDTQSSDNSAIPPLGSPIFYEPDPEMFAVIDPSCLNHSFHETLPGEPSKERPTKKAKSVPILERKALIRREKIQFYEPTNNHRCISPSKCVNPSKCMRNQTNRSNNSKEFSWRSFFYDGKTKNVDKIALVFLTALLMLFEIVRMGFYLAHNGVDNKYGQAKLGRAGVGLFFCVIIYIGLYMRNSLCLFIGIGLTFLSCWLISCWEISELHFHGKYVGNSKDEGKRFAVIGSIAAVVYMLWPILLLVTVIQLRKSWQTEPNPKKALVPIKIDTSVSLKKSENAVIDGESSKSADLSIHEKCSEKSENSKTANYSSERSLTSRRV